MTFYIQFLCLVLGMISKILTWSGASIWACISSAPYCLWCTFCISSSTWHWQLAPPPQHSLAGCLTVLVFCCPWQSLSNPSHFCKALSIHISFQVGLGWCHSLALGQGCSGPGLSCCFSLGPQLVSGATTYTALGLLLSLVAAHATRGHKRPVFPASKVYWLLRPAGIQLLHSQSSLPAATEQHAKLSFPMVSKPGF